MSVNLCVLLSEPEESIHW